MNDLSTIRRRQDDGLGSNSDIGNKLLELLDRLDEVERQNKPDKGE